MNLNLTNEQRKTAKAFLVSQVGKPYKFGAEVKDPDNIVEIDCSELAEMVYKYLGFIIPDGACNQFAFSIGILEYKADTLDLAFYKKGQAITHIAICYDENILVEASGSKGKVVITPIKEFMKGRGENKFAGFRRPACIYNMELKPIPDGIKT